MPANIESPSPALNRLRAAAALIPIIESGLADSKLSAERAASMSSFCEWALEHEPETSEGRRLAELIRTGVSKIRQLQSTSHFEQSD